MLDDLNWWRSALGGSTPLIHENDPQPGYYRTRLTRGGPWLPVAIWREPDGTLRALRDGAPADAQDLWVGCCRHPVPYETYRAVAERGEPWPDAIPATLGHNGGPGSQDPEDRAPHPADIMNAITALQAVAAPWLDGLGLIATQAEADRAANFAERFAALERQAEDARVAHKKPVLEESRAIDAAWKPVLEAASLAKKAMKRALEPFLLAEEARRQQEAEVRGAGGIGPAPARAGTGRRRVGLRRERRVVIRDREALVRAYRRDPRFWAHEGVTSVLLDLAGADLRAGRTVSGAELTHDVVAA